MTGRVVRVFGEYYVELYYIELEFAGPFDDEQDAEMAMERAIELAEGCV